MMGLQLLITHRMKANLLSGIFRVLNSNGLAKGTGFVLKDRTMGLTCYHVVQDCIDEQKSLIIHFPIQNIKLSAQLVSSSDAHQKDIAILNAVFPTDCHAFELIRSSDLNQYKYFIPLI